MPRVLRHSNFRYLFLGQAASGIGDQLVIVALALYITARTGSPADLGLVLAGQSFSLVALLLLGGVWADRLPRQRVMIATDLVRAALHGTLAVLILSGGASVPAMFVIEVLFGAARAFFQPAFAGLVPQTVSEDLIGEAQSLRAMLDPMSALIGPALGAALVLLFGAGIAFATDAATFLFSAALLSRVRPRSRGTVALTAQPSLINELREGFGEVASRPWVWVTIAVFTGAVLCGYATWYALTPLITRDAYGSRAWFGVLESVIGVGALIGATIGARLPLKYPLRFGFIVILFWPAAGVALALALPLVVVIPLVFGSGLGFAYFGVAWETGLAHYIPPHALSRVSSYDWMGSLALLPLGFALAGPLASALGARTVLGVGSALTFVLLVVGLIPRSTRMLPGAPPSAEHAAGDVPVEAGGETEIAHVDALIRVVHERC